MPVKKSFPYYDKALLNRIRIPSFNSNGGVVKRAGNPIPQNKKNEPARRQNPQNKKNETVKRTPIRKNIKGSPKYQGPVTKPKRSDKVPRQKKWNVQRLDSNLNELKWLDEEV